MKRFGKAAKAVVARIMRIPNLAVFVMGCYGGGISTVAFSLNGKPMHLVLGAASIATAVIHFKKYLKEKGE